MVQAVPITIWMYVKKLRIQLIVIGATMATENVMFQGKIRIVFIKSNS